MTVDQIVGGAIWVQLLILLAAIVFAIFEGAFCAVWRTAQFFDATTFGHGGDCLFGGGAGGDAVPDDDVLCGIGQRDRCCGFSSA